MRNSLDNFFHWVGDIKFLKDLIIRIIVVVPIAILAFMFWFISVPLLIWYGYTAHGDTRIRGCKCPRCFKLNDCAVKFCIYCGQDIRVSPYTQKTQQPKKKQCQRCNQANEMDAKFCIACGNNTFIDNTVYHEDHTIAGYVITLLAYIAKGDDVISNAEAALISKILDDLSMSDPKIRSVLKDIFNRTKDATQKDHKHISYNLNKLLAQELHSQSERFEFLSMIGMFFMALVYVDGKLNTKQNVIVIEVLKNLNFTDAQINALHNQFQETQHTDPNIPSEKDYAALNCIESDLDDKIKRSYRELAKQYHPDTLHGKDLPEAIMLMATEKFKEINAAYEKIKKYRGIK